MMPKKTDLTIIIVNHNAKDWLEQTLRTLKVFYLETTQLTVETVLVDNASSDGSVAMIKQSFPWVQLISLPENVGFAAGNNVALKQSDSRYVMLLNSDTECTPATKLDALIAYLDNHPTVAVITPKLLLPNGTLDPASHRGEPTPMAALFYFLGLEKLFPRSKIFGEYHRYYLDLNQVHPIANCSGAAMIVRTTAIAEVGLLDEQFFMYAEDLDWCRRFRLAGYQVFFHPAAKIIHHKNKSGIESTDRRKAQRTKKIFYDTMWQYYLKHYQDTPWVLRQAVKIAIKIKKGVT